ncbi:MAG: hypothetical protein CVU44_02890 [Chloroflexi bacterium HGW-Chloroflexi-6]|nr:MAG: hypothetical protein CVU44_02890 [Chloroflexi bacterium HGW-Chloroflexi-6]
MSSSNYFSRIHIWRILAFCLVALASTASVLATVTVARAAILAAPSISVTKSDAIIDDGVLLAEAADGKADPGETIEYSVFINNSGPDPATGVAFNDTIDANTTLLAGSINVSPLAGDDTYATIGNTLLEVGVTASGSPAVQVTSAAMDSLFDNDTEFLGDTFTLKSVEADSVAPFITATESGGSVTVEADGNFSYTPPVGFSGADHFDYVITDDGPDNIAGNADDLTGAGRVTINVNTQTVWYVNNDAAAGGLGRSSDPFDTLAEAQAASAANQTIYVFHAGGDLTGQNAGILLKDGQRLIGEGVELTMPVVLVHQGVNGPNPTSLKAAGSHPRIGNTGGNGISVSNDVPSEIRGLSISGFSNAIDLTIADASTGTLNIKDNIIFGATNDEGIDINHGGSGVLTLDVQNNTWNTSSPTHAGNALDVNATATGNLTLNFSNNTNILSTGANGIVLVDAGGSGLLTVTGFANNTIHGDTVGTGISANTVIFDATPGGSFDLVSGGTTTVGASGNGVGSSGMMLTSVSGNLSFTDLDIVASGGTGLSATSGVAYTGSAGFRLAVGAGVATVDANGGSAVNLSTVDMSLPFSAVTSVNSIGTGVSLGSVTGTFSAGTGSSITNAGTTDFVVSNSNATITYNGSITDASGPGVSLSTNTGSTIAFTGSLTISSGASTAFSAVGGGTLSATDTTSTLISTSGTALNVANTTIGASNLIFRSISSNGGSATGIILDNTGTIGGLQVLGDGSNTSFGGNGSGGTITNKSGTDGSNTTGVGIYLNNTSHVVLRRMNLSNFNNFAIRGLNVNNFILEYCTINHSSGKIGDNAAIDEGSIYFGIENPGGTNGLTGTATVTSCLIEDGFENNFKIANLSGTLSQFTMTGTTVRDTSTASPGNNGLEFRAQGTANITADITTSTFTGNRANGIQVTTTTEHTGTVDVEIGTAGVAGSGGTFTNNNIGVNIAHGSAGTLNFDVHRGTYSNPGFTAIFGGTPASPININLAAGGGGPMYGWVTNNTITNVNSQTGPGIRVITNGTDADNSNVLTIAVNNNNISQVANYGIEMAARDGNSDINATVNNNTVQLLDPLSSDGIRVSAGATSADTTSVCLAISGNDSDTAGTNGIRIRNRFAGTTFRLPSYGGAATDGDGTHDAVIAHLAGLNSQSSNISADHAVGNSGFTSGAACATPVAMQPDGNIFVQAQPESNPQVELAIASQEVSGSGRSSLDAIVRSAVVEAREIAPVAQASDANLGSGKPLFALVQPAPIQSGDVLPTVTIGTLPAGKSVTIEFRATVDALDPGEIRTRILNQGTVSGSNFTSLTTTDPSPNADPFCIASPSIGTQTCTPVDRPDTTIVSLTRTDSNPNNTTSVGWQIIFANPVSGLTASNFSLVPGGGVTGASIDSIGTAIQASEPDTTWNITVDTGTGDGTLGLNFVNDTNTSYEVTTTLPYVGEVYTIDKTSPTVTGATYNSNTGCLGSSPYYCNASDTVQISVAFSEVVAVNTFGGTPSLSLNSGGTAAYLSGTNSNTLVFEYTIAAGQNASDLDYTSTSALTLNGGTIQDAATNNATLTLASPGASGSLGNDENLVVDTTAPTATNFNRLTPATTPTNADTLTWQAIFSESVTDVNGDGSDFAIPALTGDTISVSSVNATTYDVTVSGGDLAGFNGLVDLNFDSPTINDLAGNALSNTVVGFDQHYMMDNTTPTVTVNQAVGQDDPTNSGPVYFTVIFSESVGSSFTTGDVDLSASTTPGTLIGSVSETAPNDGTTFTVAVTGMTGNGDVIATIAAGVASDGVNTNSASTSTDNSVAYDITAPTVTINQKTSAPAQADPTASDPINFTVTFSEAVSDFDDSADVTLGGTAGGTLSATITGGPTVYNVAVSGMTSDGTVTASLPAGAATDGANLSEASTSTDNSVLFDTAAPSVTVNQKTSAPAQADPTNSGPINFTVVFSEAVTDFDDASDLNISGTATGTLSGVITGGPTTYNVAVSGMTGDGTVILDIPASVAIDGGGNPNTLGTFTDHTVTYDTTAPAAPVVVAPANGSFTNDTTPGVSGTAAPNATVSIYIDTLLNGTTTSDGSGNWSHTSTALSTGPHDVKATVTDSANNTSPDSSTNTFTVDITDPTVTINQKTSAPVQADPTGATPINFTVVFSEAVTGFATGDVTLGGAAGATLGTVTEIAPNDGTTYNVAVSGMTSDGTVIVTIAASVAQDLAGNPNAASTSTDNSVLYDTVAPSVTVNQKSSAPAQADPTNDSPINFTVIFSEAVTDFDDAADLNITGTAAGTLSGVITGGPTSYNVAVSGMTSAGTVILDIPANAAVDGGGNPNGSATFTDHTVTYVPPTDLSITKTDGVTNATPGGSVTYTITASNAGPNADPAATVADTFPGILTATWTCVGAGGGTCTAAGSGNINDTVNLPVGGSVTYTVSATISAAATGSLANTATVATSSDVADTTPANNSATDTDTLVPQADLGITKTDGVTTATPGGSVTYTITASNAGPSNAPGSTVADTFPASLTATWTCVGAGGGTCTAAGSGDINDTVNLPAGGSVTYTVSATISPSATGSLSNTAIVTASVTDPSPANNSATDTDTLAPQADLSITKTDGSAIAVVGNSLTYTITASNSGPSNAPGSTVADTFPADLTGITWTCVGAGGGTCTAAGSGNINDTVNLPAGGSVTYTANATVSLAATGTLSNTATVSEPGSVTDPSSANNSATDSDTVVPPVEVTVNKAGAQADPTNGATINFTVVFGSAVTGFDDADVTLGGTAGATTATVTGGPTSYNVAVTGMTGDGTVIATIVAGVATGSQGQPNAASTSTDNSVIFDATAPDTTITNDPVPSGFTNLDSISFNFTGDDGTGVGGLTFECDLDGGGFSACTSPANYPGPLADGPHTFSVRAEDSLGNTDPSPDTYTWTVDTSEPSVVVSSITTSPTNVSPITVTITFDEPVTGFTPSVASGDIVIGGVGGVDSNPSGSGATYSFDLAPSGQGAVTVQVPDSSAIDDASNWNPVSNLFSITYDTTAPTVTIEQASGQADPTGFSPINFTAVFSEAVTGFTGADITLSGTAGATMAVVTEVAPNDGTTYNVAVSGMTTSGTVIASIPTSVASDAATNANEASTSTDNMVDYNHDIVPPVVISSLRADPDPTSAASVDFTVTFSETVTGVDVSDFDLTTSGVQSASISGVSGTGAVYTVTVSTGSGNGSIRLDVLDDDTIVDEVLNPLGSGFTSGQSYTVTGRNAIFADVPFSYWANSYIERLYNAGITGGCGLSPLIYCPDKFVTRAEMAVFLLKSMHGPAFSPPPATGTVFNDVPVTYWAAAWIEQLAAEGVTAGCGNGNYCPNQTATTRAQMAVFLLRGKYGSAYTPPAATGVFGDVPTDYWAAAWIEQLAAEGITSGCGGGNYCPELPLTRAQMAVFLVRTFNLP